jgi:hypothetical protein
MGISWKKLKNFLISEEPNHVFHPLSFFASCFGLASSPVVLGIDLTWWKS